MFGEAPLPTTQMTLFYSPKNPEGVFFVVKITTEPPAERVANRIYSKEWTNMHKGVNKILAMKTHGHLANLTHFFNIIMKASRRS